MYFQTTTVLAVLASFVATGSALGINCKGNSNCASQGDNTLREIHNALLSIDSSQAFSNGQHITCQGGTNQICAFYQNVDGTGTAGEAASLVGDLLSHGCTICGSAPTGSGNDVSQGELTCNWVS